MTCFSETACMKIIHSTTHSCLRTQLNFRQRQVYLLDLHITGHTMPWVIVSTFRFIRSRLKMHQNSLLNFCLFPTLEPWTTDLKFFLQRWNVFIFKNLAHISSSMLLNVSQLRNLRHVAWSYGLPRFQIAYFFFLKICDPN